MDFNLTGTILICILIKPIKHKLKPRPASVTVIALAFPMGKPQLVSFHVTINSTLSYFDHVT